MEIDIDQLLGIRRWAHPTISYCMTTPQYKQQFKSVSERLCQRCGKSRHISQFYRSQELDRYQARANIAKETIGDQFPASDEIQKALHVLSVASTHDKEWIIDSGASRHFSGNQIVFSKLEPLSHRCTIATVDGKTHNVRGQGNIKIVNQNDEINRLRDVYILS